MSVVALVPRVEACFKIALTVFVQQMASYVRPPIESVLLSTNKSAIVEVTANFAPVKNISYLVSAHRTFA